MKILMTGSGGADGIPSYFGNSRVSEHARTHGGKDIRYRAGAVLDGVVKIDWGPDTFASCSKLSLRALDWKYVVFTHSHDDHYAPRELQYVFPPFLPAEGQKPVVFGNQAILDGFENTFNDIDLLDRRLIRSFEMTEVGDYEVTPIRAYHKLDEDSMNLIFRKDGQCFLYASDTGVYQEPTWEFLADHKFDGMIIECTDGFNPMEYWGHLCVDELMEVLERMQKIGCIDDATKICTTHHAASGMATHEELVDKLEPQGITVGYDGLAFEI